MANTPMTFPSLTLGNTHPEPVYPSRAAHNGSHPSTTSREMSRSWERYLNMAVLTLLDKRNTSQPFVTPHTPDAKTPTQMYILNNLAKMLPVRYSSVLPDGESD